MRALDSIDEVIRFCADAEATQPAHQAAQSMSSVYAKCREADALRFLDPFSDQYFTAAQALYSTLASVASYDPWVNERTPYVDLSRVVTTPTPYQYADSATVADFMLSWGWILRSLNVKAGARVLEYGAGEGQLSIHLARMGCEVSIIDIDERYLEAVQAQCKAFGLNIETVKGEFGDGIPGKKFDRIVFFEAFHHAFDHAKVLSKLAPLLADDGFIVLSGEPIGPCGEAHIPFAWGPRLDGLAVRSTRRFGWCELGFQRPYLVERLMRSGFTCQFIPCPVTGRGDCYILRPIKGELKMGDDFLIQVHGKDAGWHGAEGAHRWTSFNSILPVPCGTSKAQMRVANYLPFDRTVALTSGKNSAVRKLKPGERAEIEISIGAPRLEVGTDTARTLADRRELGIAVESVRFG